MVKLPPELVIVAGMAGTRLAEAMPPRGPTIVSVTRAVLAQLTLALVVPLSLTGLVTDTVREPGPGP